MSFNFSKVIVVLMVLAPPKKDTTYCQKTSYSLAVGDTKQICCPVSGYPPPFFTWKKDGVQLKGEDSVLTITISGERDFGNYTCTATDFRTPLKPIYIPIEEKGNLCSVIGVNNLLAKSPVFVVLWTSRFSWCAWLAHRARVLASHLENESLPKTSKQLPWGSEMWVLIQFKFICFVFSNPVSRDALS